MGRAKPCYMATIIMINTNKYLKVNEKYYVFTFMVQFSFGLVKTYILTGDLPKFEANTKVAAKI